MTTTKMAFKYRAYPTRSQARYIDECIHSCWWFYRYVLHQYEEDYRQAKENYQKEVLSYYDLNVAYHPFWFRRELGKVKIPKEFYPFGAPIGKRGSRRYNIKGVYMFVQKARSEYPYLKNIPSVVMHEVTERVIYAREKFFNGVSRYPRYPKEKYYKSITWMSDIELLSEEKLLRLSKFPGLLKIVYHRPVKGKIKRATISKDTLGRYYISIMCEFAEEAISTLIGENNIVGIDMNIKAIDESLRSFITLSTGEKVNIPRWYTQYSVKLVKVQKKMSKTKLGSKEWRKYNRWLQHIYDDIQNKKDYWLHNITRELADRYDCVVIEDMNLTDFRKKRNKSENVTNVQLSCDRGRRKAWNETPFGIFKRQLGYKLGARLIVVNPAYTSKTCNKCGYVNNELTLNDREWKCPSCGKLLDRDVNAAMNIRDAGIVLVKQQQED